MPDVDTRPVATDRLADRLAEAIRQCHQPFAPIALRGGYAVDRGEGLIELVPEHPEPNAAPTIISAGIHGNETAPIELLLALAHELDAERVIVAAPVLLIIGHPGAIVAGSRYCQTNLNRLFRRDLAGDSLEHGRAGELMDAVDDFWTRHGQSAGSLHLDMRTAIRDSRYPRFAVEPAGEPPISTAVWQAIAGAGLQAVLTQRQASWTFSHYSRAYHGVAAFKLELERVALFGANDLAALTPM